MPHRNARPILSRLEALPDGRAGVGKRQIWFAWSVIAALVIVGLAATRFADTMLVVVPGFFAIFEFAMFIVNLMLAALLFIKGRIQKRGDTIRLGTAYLFVTLIIIPQMASFAGGFMPVPLIGTPQTALWLWSFWHLGFAMAILRYAWFAARPTPPGSSVSLSVLMAVASTSAAAYVACTCTEILPTVLANGHFVYGGTAVLFWLPLTVCTVAALALVARLRPMSPERLWLVVGLVASCLDVWLNLHGTGRYTVGWYLAKVGSLVTSVAVLMSLLHDITSLYSEAETANEMLRTLTRRDGLTGISNRRHFDELLGAEFRRAARQELPLALVMLDIDYFKGYNDRYGHLGGDECLRLVSSAVEGTLLRPGDNAARYGGEEIAVLLPTTDLAGASVIAERVRAAVEALGVEHAGSPFGVVTVSAGVASFVPPRANQEPTDLVGAADAALYRAKKESRNCFRVQTDEAVPVLRVPAAVS